MPGRKISKRFRRLKHYLIPHAGNGFKPRIFAVESVVAMLLVLGVLEGAYYVQTALVYKNTDFLASVLPGAIAMLTNETRTGSGLAALAEDPVLDKAAQAKADDMAARGYFAHVSPDGKTPWYWLKEAGYDYGYAGENLAVNFIDSSDVEKAWIESPPHYANIIKSEYTKTGVGVSHGMYEGKLTVFVVQFFATPAYAETVPVAPPKKVVQTPAAPPPSPTPVAAAPNESRVLGTEVQTAQAKEAGSALEKVATSPKYLVGSIIGAIIAALCTLFLVVFFVKAKVRHRVKHMEAIGGGVAVCLIALGLVWFNDMAAAPVGVPADGLAASVSLSL